MSHVTIRMDGPCIIFGGPYSNLEATRALLDEAARLGIPADRIICTGDVVAYGADPRATVGLIRRVGLPVAMGNCEESLASGSGNCSCGFVPGSACDRLSAVWFAHARSELDADARRWMAELPRRIDLEIAGRQLAVLHGGVNVINRFVFASTAAAIKAEELDQADCGGIIAGHCGLPFTQVIRDRLWHNSGAIGMPANDGTPRVWFSLLVPEAGGLRIEHRALDYDYASAADKIRRVGLPEAYAAALETGLWPTCDVLPLKEIREIGVPLEQGDVHWRAPTQLQGRPRLERSGYAQLWPRIDRDGTPKLRPDKFKDPERTATGEARAKVALRRLKTLWFNTGTRCNVACRNCYIESSPHNDRLVYLERAEVAAFLDEIERDEWGTEEIGFTGGEPLMNPDLLGMIDDCLSRGFRVLVLTNAMRPLQRCKSQLLDLNNRAGEKFMVRVSLDHYTPERHAEERGPRTFQPTLDGLIWLARSGFKVSVAGRTMWGEDPVAERAGYARLFAEHGIPIDADDSEELVLFPELDPKVDVPEITTQCWDVLGKSAEDVMCADSRMVVKRKGSAHPVVVSCTLIPYDQQFELGRSLSDAARSVSLNHPHCAKFCVLGGASCSARGRSDTEPPVPRSAHRTRCAVLA